MNAHLRKIGDVSLWTSLSQACCDWSRYSSSIAFLGLKTSSNLDFHSKILDTSPSPHPKTKPPLSYFIHFYISLSPSENLIHRKLTSSLNQTTTHLSILIFLFLNLFHPSCLLQVPIWLRMPVIRYGFFSCFETLSPSPHPSCFLHRLATSPRMHKPKPVKLLIKQMPREMYGSLFSFSFSMTCFKNLGFSSQCFPHFDFTFKL